MTLEHLLSFSYLGFIVSHFSKYCNTVLTSIQALTTVEAHVPLVALTTFGLIRGNLDYVPSKRHQWRLSWSANIWFYRFRLYSHGKNMLHLGTEMRLAPHVTLAQGQCERLIDGALRVWLRYNTCIRTAHADSRETIPWIIMGPIHRWFLCENYWHGTARRAKNYLAMWI